MGHLINPTGFRLSVLHNWKDNWMSSNFIVYSELLHNINSIKEAVRDHLRVTTKITPIIYSHFNVEQLFSEKISLRVYYYDSDIEFKYRDLRYACKRIYFNHKRLYKSFFKMHCHFLPEIRTLSKQEKVQFFYASLVRRGFFEYLLLRKLIFLFLCAMVRDDVFKKNPALLLQIKLGVFSLLEYNWRKNLFLGKPLNFFEFFLNVFLQMQFIEQNVSTNLIRASLYYHQQRKSYVGIGYDKNNGLKRKPIGKYIELSFLSKWFKFSRLNLMQKLLSDRKRLIAFVKRQGIMDEISLKKSSFYFDNLSASLKLRTSSDVLRKFKDVYKLDSTQKFCWESAQNLVQRKNGFNEILTNTSTFRAYEKVALGYLTKMGSLFYWMSEDDLNGISTSHMKYPSYFMKSLYEKSRKNVFKLKMLEKFLNYNFRANVCKNNIVVSSCAGGPHVFKHPQEHMVESLADINNWSLFIYTYIKYSHNLWYNSSQLLSRFLQGKYLSYYNLYSTLSKHWVSMSIWAVNLFLDFYRIFLARTYYIYRFGFSKLNIESKLNQISMLPVEIEFFGFDNDWVTAPFVAFYLARKFEQDFTIKELFKPICRDLKRIATRTPYLLGYKLQFVGRLTRRDRLRTSWVLGGRVPLSTITANVEYGNDFGVLRNGVCSVRVWLYRPKFVGDPSWTYLYKIVF